MVGKSHKQDIKQFRQAAQEAGLTTRERHKYSAEFHNGNRWAEDGEPGYSWFVQDMRDWKEESTGGY